MEHPFQSFVPIIAPPLLEVLDPLRSSGGKPARGGSLADHAGPRFADAFSESEEVEPAGPLTEEHRMKLGQ
jgi:hypothetical protein